MGVILTSAVTAAIGTLIICLILGLGLFFKKQRRNTKATQTEQKIEAISQNESDEIAKLLGTATMYREGRGTITADHAEAIKWYRRAAELGSTEAQTALQKLGDDWEVDVDALFELGKNLAVGANGEQENPEEAVRVLEKAARYGSSVASHFLATAYYRGTSVKKDMVKAKVWYRKGAEQGNEESKIALQMLEEAERDR